jgi:predicted nucleotidyltransferase
MGLHLVILFGSAARSTRGPSGDIDIAVRGSRPVDLVAATNRLIELLHFQEIDLVDLNRASPLLLAVVARDGVLLFEDQPARFNSFRSFASRRFADTRKFREAEARQLQKFAERGHANGD